MDRGFSGKRLHEGDLADYNGKKKRQNQGSFNNRELDGGSFMPHDLSVPLVPMNVPDNAVFRILCPALKIGSVIGKGGNIIKNLRQESGAKIKIADAIPGVDERVIIISSTDHESDRSRSNNKSSHDSRLGRDPQLSKRDVSKDNEKLTPVQEALFKVHARIIGDIDTSGCDGSDQDEDSSQQLVTRLLVPNNQIGCLLGKGGKIIEQMRETTGAQIRVLPKDQLPGCALPTDELVQIFGDGGTLKKALISISSRLQENPPRDRPQSFLPLGSTFLPVNHYLQKDSFHTKGNGPLFGLEGSAHLERSGWAFSNENRKFLGDRSNNKRNNKDGRDVGRNELVFRLLCPSDKIGCIIGKGGSIIHNLRKETGARIKIADVVPGCNERVIIVSADELPEESFSPAIEAMIHVQSRIITKIGDDKDGLVTTRLLVPTNQIGCLLGKGGNIIASMRKATRANICILPKDNLPRCTQETDEPVQEMKIVGDANVVREALFQVISKLRNNVFRERGNEARRGTGRARALGVSLPPQSGIPGKDYNNLYDFGGRMEPNSHGSAVFTLPRMDLNGAFQISSDFGSLGSSSNTWDIGGGGGLSSLSSFGGGPTHFIQPLAGSFAGGGNRAIENHETSLGTMSTVEVHIPNSSIGSIIGIGGNNIAHIRQISGAKVKLHNNEQGAKDRILELSGTQEQTHIAQSLVQTYMQSSLEGNGIISSSRFAT